MPHEGAKFARWSGARAIVHRMKKALKQLEATGGKAHIRDPFAVAPPPDTVIFEEVTQQVAPQAKRPETPPQKVKKEKKPKPEPEEESEEEEENGKASLRVWKYRYNPSIVAALNRWWAVNENTFDDVDGDVSTACAQALPDRAFALQLVPAHHARARPACAEPLSSPFSQPQTSALERVELSAFTRSHAHVHMIHACIPACSYTFTFHSPPIAASTLRSHYHLLSSRCVRPQGVMDLQCDQYLGILRKVAKAVIKPEDYDPYECVGSSRSGPQSFDLRV